MANRPMSKFQDGKMHIFTPSGLWGDQILNFFAINYCLNKYNYSEVIIHTAKDVLNPHHDLFYPANGDILKFWSTFKFVKGIIFDMDQRTMYEDAGKSQYEWFPFLNEVIPPSYTYNLCQSIDFSLFPKSNFKMPFEQRPIAVFQPISLENKPKDSHEKFICSWSKSVKTLISKGYAVYMIGGGDDQRLLEKWNYKLLEDREFKNAVSDGIIKNFIGKLTMFEAIYLVMNRASFVLSCCSWAAWYGIAARVKTAFCAGPVIEAGLDDKYINLITNKDIFYMDYSSKKEYADESVSKWIRENA